MSAAIISPDGVYRYTLERVVNAQPAGNIRDRLCWVMLNPSSADAELDDPTIRRVKRFTADAGYSDLIVVNLFALRATSPDELLRHPAPRGSRSPSQGPAPRGTRPTDDRDDRAHDMNGPDERLVELDERRRCPLGRIGRKEHTIYLGRCDDDGTIILEPAVVLPISLIEQLDDATDAGNATLAGKLWHVVRNRLPHPTTEPTT